MSEEYSIPPEISIYTGEPIGDLAASLEQNKAKKILHISEEDYPYINEIKDNYFEDNTSKLEIKIKDPITILFYLNNIESEQLLNQFIEFASEHSGNFGAANCFLEKKIRSIFETLDKDTSHPYYPISKIINDGNSLFPFILKYNNGWPIECYNSKSFKDYFNINYTPKTTTDSSKMSPAGLNPDASEFIPAGGAAAAGGRGGPGVPPGRGGPGVPPGRDGPSGTGAPRPPRGDARGKNNYFTNQIYIPDDRENARPSLMASTYASKRNNFIDLLKQDYTSFKDIDFDNLTIINGFNIISTLNNFLKLFCTFKPGTNDNEFSTSKPGGFFTLINTKDFPKKLFTFEIIGIKPNMIDNIKRLCLAVKRLLTRIQLKRETDYRPLIGKVKKYKNIFKVISDLFDELIATKDTKITFNIGDPPATPVPGAAEAAQAPATPTPATPVPGTVAATPVPGTATKQSKNIQVYPSLEAAEDQPPQVEAAQAQVEAAEAAAEDQPPEGAAEEESEEGAPAEGIAENKSFTFISCNIYNGVRDKVNEKDIVNFSQFLSNNDNKPDILFMQDSVLPRSNLYEYTTNKLTKIKNQTNDEADNIYRYSISTSYKETIFEYNNSGAIILDKDFKYVKYDKDKPQSLIGGTRLKFKEINKYIIFINVYIINKIEEKILSEIIIKMLNMCNYELDDRIIIAGYFNNYYKDNKNDLIINYVKDNKTYAIKLYLKQTQPTCCGESGDKINDLLYDSKEGDADVKINNTTVDHNFIEAKFEINPLEKETQKIPEEKKKLRLNNYQNFIYLNAFFLYDKFSKYKPTTVNEKNKSYLEELNKSYLEELNKSYENFTNYDRISFNIFQYKLLYDAINKLKNEDYINKLEDDYGIFKLYCRIESLFGVYTTLYYDTDEKKRQKIKEILSSTYNTDELDIYITNLYNNIKLFLKDIRLSYKFRYEIIIDYMIELNNEFANSFKSKQDQDNIKKQIIQEEKEKEKQELEKDPDVLRINTIYKKIIDKETNLLKLKEKHINDVNNIEINNRKLEIEQLKRIASELNKINEARNKLIKENAEKGIKGAEIMSKEKQLDTQKEVKIRRLKPMIKRNVNAKVIYDP